MRYPVDWLPLSIEAFVDPRQTYTDGEWARPNKPDGTPYSRGYHGGYDLQSSALGYSSDLYAICSGVVEHAYFGAALGRFQFVIRRTSGDGFLYCHTASRPADGERVAAGDLVAREGGSGGVPTHLHLEYLRAWDDWRSTANYGESLRERKDLIVSQLDDIEKKVEAQAAWVEGRIKQATVDIISAIIWGRNGPYLPDEWAARVAAANIEKVKAAAGGGVDPAVLEAACERAVRKVFADGATP